MPTQSRKSRKPSINETPEVVLDPLEVVSRLAQVETQLGFLTSSNKELSDLIRETEQQRSSQYTAYIEAHAKIVGDCEGNTEKISKLEGALNSLALSTKEEIRTIAETTAESIKEISGKVGSMPTVIKILGIVGTIFMGAISIFIAELIRGNIQLVHVVH